MLCVGLLLSNSQEDIEDEFNHHINRGYILESRNQLFVLLSQVFNTAGEAFINSHESIELLGNITLCEGHVDVWHETVVKLIWYFIKKFNLFVLSRLKYSCLKVFSFMHDSFSIDGTNVQISAIGSFSLLLISFFQLLILIIQIIQKFL